MSTIYTDYEEKGFNLFGIKFAPLWIPLHRRWETICFTLSFYLLVGLEPFMPYIIIYMLRYYQFRYFLLFYMCWYIYDRNTPFTGGRKPKIFRRFSWRCFISARNYLPSKLVKMVDLPPNTNYLFATFPHGIAIVAVVTNFMMDVEFRKLFPKLDCRYISLSTFFYMPFIRDILLFIGCSGSNKENIMCHLNSPKNNKAVLLLVGGFAELLLSQPGANKIVINKRKGFVKLALKAGVPLVPVYSFGENEVMRHIHSERLIKIQDFFRKYLGTAPFMANGRGIFQYTFGIIPHRRKVTTVVGKPITLPKIENPTQGDVDEYHAKFKEALIELFETNKEKYDPKGTDAQLICV